MARMVPEDPAAEVRLLHSRLERLVDDYVEQFGVDVSDLRFGGAAGGLAGGLAAIGVYSASPAFCL